MGEIPTGRDESRSGDGERSGMRDYMCKPTRDSL